jgi:hypothetical protein
MMTKILFYLKLVLVLIFFVCLYPVFLILTTGVYGDVHRVKILFNKKDTALIQMAEPHQAQLGK